MEQLLFFGLVILVGLANFLLRLWRSRGGAPRPPEDASDEPVAPPPVALPPRARPRLDEDGLAAEDPVWPPRERHREGDPAPPPARVPDEPRPPAVPVPMAARLRGAGGLREAIVLRTVLGPCRGLEEANQPDHLKS